MHEIIKSAVEIGILWFVIYHIILFLETTRAIQVLRGAALLIIAFVLIDIFNLSVLSWIFTKVIGVSLIAILIIYHTEIRQGLARLGQWRLFSPALKEEELNRLLQEVSKAAEELSKQKFGALIVIEKHTPLNAYAENGVTIDSRVSAELVEAIFTPNNPLHDGGIIIQGSRITAAGCLFPLTQKQDLSRVYGTRHRAALGLSEETDALIIIVSEERQDISLVYKERLYKDLSQQELQNKIAEFIRSKK
jgi:diadenylate cyclase